MGTFDFELVKGEERITSLEIAELTGKAHKDVMKAIRSMEPAWEKITGRNFALSEYKDSTGRSLPCYHLSKLESLYIITKFNNEARAKLVMRWAELEWAEQQRVYEMALRNVKDAEYAHRVLKSIGTLTATQIAKEMDLSAMAMNKMLHEMGIIFKQSGEWQLYAQYHGRGLVDKETLLPDGQWRCPRRMRWTEQGHRFLNELVSKRKAARLPKIKSIQLTLNFDITA